jgi:hypothetical protein
MVRRISQGSSEISSWWASSKPRRDASLALGLAALIAVFRREQTPAYAVVSLHVRAGVILTAKAPNCRRSLRLFGGRDDAGPRSPNTRERKWTRPHCSSSSSWCCCSAAVDSSTDAGLESERAVGSPGSVAAPNGRCTAPTGCRRIVARSATVHVARFTSDTSLHGPFAEYKSFVRRNRETPQGRGPRTPLAAT